MSTWDETRERLHEQADREYPQAWVPQADGDELVGVVTGVKEAVSTRFGPVPVVEVVDPVGAAWSIWLVHVVLRRSFARERPAIGETVLIRYLGRITPDSGGNPYDDYKLVVDRPDEGNDVNWSAIAERYDPDLTRDPVPPAIDDESVPF
jgi:hypothetical protein